MGKYDLSRSTVVVMIAMVIMSLSVGIFIGKTIKQQEEIFFRKGNLNDPIKLYGFEILAKTEIIRGGKAAYYIDLENVLPGSKRMILRDMSTTKWIYNHVEFGKSYLKLKDLPPADPNVEETPPPSLETATQRSEHNVRSSLFS